MRKNNAGRVITDLMIRMIRSFYDGTLPDRIDKIPVEMRPRNNEAMRCCIYKDRAMLRYRLLALLGFAREDETDESKFLMEYLAEAEHREKYTNPHVLSVLDVACESCVESQYLVTNACRGCFARPCETNCPKQAIQVIDGKSVIDQKKCIDCGKCTQVCPYHAIVRVPIPCEEACPVDAIRKDADGKERIDFDRCIACGKCLVACPFSAILERSQLIDILVKLRQKRRVVAMVAPAIVGQFAGTLGQISSALKKAGFHHMEEVAFGAEETTAHEAEEFIERMEEGKRLMTTSCCPAYVEAVRRHVPDLVPFVSTTPSPMRFSAAKVKREDPECISVFIGPCVAKRFEGLEDKNIDYVMTFEELGALLVALEINVGDMPDESTAEAKGYARGFASSCGVTTAILHDTAELRNDGKPLPEIDGKFINGIDKKTVKMLQLYADGKLPGNFLEVMACPGGCVGGPCALGDVRLATLAVKKVAGKPVEK